MRGQAFVSFDSQEAAEKAVKEVKGFPLYSKPMVCSLRPRPLQRLRSLDLRSAANILREDAVGCYSAEGGSQ